MDYNKPLSHYLTTPLKLLFRDLRNLIGSTIQKTQTLETEVTNIQTSLYTIESVEKAEGVKTAICVNTTDSQEFSNLVIPAGSLQNGDIIKLDFSARYLNNSVSNGQLRLVLKINSGADITIASSGVLAVSAQNRLVTGSLTILYSNNNFNIQAVMDLSNTTATVNSTSANVAMTVSATNAVNATVANTLSFRFSTSIADPNISVTPVMSIIKSTIQ